MALKFAPPPAGGNDVVRDGLAAVHQAQQAGAPGGAAMAVPSAPNLMEPFPVYELGLDQLAAGKGLDASRLVAWRYLLVDAQRQHVAQAAEITPASGGASQFSAITTGYAAKSEEAFRIAESLPQLDQHEFELRALRVPALYVMAVWLKDQDGDDDLFVVIPPAFPPLQPYQVYERKDLLRLLHQAARTKEPLEKAVVPP
jgi:hypothetical protein